MCLARSLAAVLLSAVVFAPVSGQQPRLDLRSFVGTWTEDVTQRRAVTSGLTYTFSQEADGFITIVRAGVDLRDRVRFDGKDYETAGVPGRAVSMTIRPDGQEYAATGPNSLPGMTTSAEAIDTRSFRRTTLREHKPLFETVMTLSSDGKRLTVTSRPTGTTDIPTMFVYNRQD